MTLIKRIIFLLGILTLFSLYTTGTLWYGFTKGVDSVIDTAGSVSEESESEVTLEEEVSNAVAEEPAVQETLNGSLAEEVPEEGVAIPEEALTDTQRQLLSTLGLDPDTFVLTPEMVSCLEDKAGRERLEEIMNGATPGVLESASFLSCL